MKILNIKQIMIRLMCLFQMKQFEPEKEESKFIQRADFTPFISVASEISKNVFLLEEESFSEEKPLPNISFSVKCMFVDDYNLYDIRGLGINTIKTDQGGHEQEFDDVKIYYNFCFDLKLSKIKGCENLKEKTQLVAVKDGKCESLAGSINKGNKWSILSKNVLQIELNNNTQNKNLNKTHRIYYKLQCNKDEHLKIDKNLSYYEKEIEDIKETVLYIKTKEACVKYDFYLIWKFINDYVAIFALVLIVFGFFNCILGKKFAKITSFILTLFSVTILVLIFSQYILPSGCAQWIIWVMLVLGIILGCTAGYFVFNHHEKFLSFLVGGVAGFFLGEFLFNLFGNAIPGNLTLIHILFVVFSIIILIILAYFLKDIIIIFATSFIGAYTLIRGISLFAGGFPNEFTVIDLKQRDEIDQLKNILTWRVYVYLVAIVIATGLSIYIQFKINKEKQEEECPNDPIIIKDS